MISPLILLGENLSSNLLSPLGYIILSIFIGLGLIMIIWLTGKRGGTKGWYAGETDYRDEPTIPNETDEMNRLMGNMRREKDPSKYELTPLLCQQFITNHARRELIPHDQFPVEKPNCHMSSVQVEKFARIWESLPWTCGADAYIVHGGLVRYRENNEPVRSNSYIVKIIEGYERTGGAWPKLNKFEDDIRKLDREENPRQGKWDYALGLPPSPPK